MRTLLLFLACLPLAFAAPHFEPAILDLGTGAQGTVINGTAVLVNDSQETLKILSVNTDCGCTASKPAKMVLGAGEQTEFSVKFETREYRELVTRNVTVDTTQGLIRLPVRVKVNPYGGWKVTPESMAFPLTKQEEASALHFTLTAPESKTLWSPQVRSITTDIPEVFSVEYTVKDAQYDIVVTRVAGAKLGTHIGSVHVLTNDPVKPELTIPISATVRGALTIIPDPLLLGATRVGETKSLTFYVMGWKSTENPEFTVPNGKVEIINRNSDHIQARLTLTPAQEGLLSTTLIMARTGSGSLQERSVLEVPARMRVLPKNN